MNGSRRDRHRSKRDCHGFRRGRFENYQQKVTTMELKSKCERKGSLRRVKGIAMGAEGIVIRKEGIAMRAKRIVLIADGIAMGTEEVALGAEGYSNGAEGIKM